MAKATHPFLAACRREESSYTPVWLMRQAGRYMEEYRKLRAEHDFLALCKNSDLAAEITITPVERLAVDRFIEQQPGADPRHRQGRDQGPILPA